MIHQISCCTNFFGTVLYNKGPFWAVAVLNPVAAPPHAKLEREAGEHGAERRRSGRRG